MDITFVICWKWYILVSSTPILFVIDFGVFGFTEISGFLGIRMYQIFHYNFWTLHDACKGVHHPKIIKNISP